MAGQGGVWHSEVQLAALLAKSEAAAAAAAAHLKEVAAELDGVKIKLLTERASNKRHMEFSAEVRSTGLTAAESYASMLTLLLILTLCNPCCRHPVHSSELRCSSDAAALCFAAAWCIC
jgi:hypothetical protein